MGEWLAFTLEHPRMCVSAKTEEIARSVVQKGITWRQEKKVKLAKDEVIRLIEGDIESPPIEETVEDTAPSEILSSYEQSAYMLGDEGC